MGPKRVLREPKDYVKTEDLVPPSWKQKFIAKYGKVIEFASRAIHIFQQQDGVDQIFLDFYIVTLLEMENRGCQHLFGLKFIGNWFELLRLGEKHGTPEMGKNNWQFNNPRRARFASVGLIDLM
ncbi:unnamed protein product [Caenorhabditis nigoni]